MRDRALYLPTYDQTGSSPVRQQGDWSHLPSNLWAAIFYCNSPCNPKYKSYYGTHAQSQFLNLRMVCQTFNKVFQEYGYLVSNAFVGEHIQSCQLPSLVSWLRCHDAHVKHLHLQEGSPWLEAALMALRSPHACLEVVHSYDAVPDTAVVLLSHFQSINFCTLHSSKVACLNLEPLSCLPLLTKLVLRSGRFSGLGAVGQLTALYVNSAKVTCRQYCSFVTSLLELKLYHAHLLDFHPRNVSACLCLRSLVLSSAFVGSGGFDEDFAFPDYNEASIPSGLSTLTALTELALDYPYHEMQLDWLTAVSALQTSSLQAFQATFPASWTIMTNLKTLKVAMDSIGDNTHGSDLTFQFDLDSLASLHTLHLSWLSVSGEYLSGLTSLQGLRKVSLMQVKPFDVRTASEIARLAFDLGRYRHDVQFNIYFT